MKYDNLILESKIYLKGIVVAMDTLLELSENGKSKKTLQKQQNLFDDLRYKEKDEKFYKFYQGYLKKTTKNLQSIKVYEHVSSMKIRDALEKANIKNIKYDQINKIVNLATSGYDLKTAIISLSKEYKETLDKIKSYERSNELEVDADKRRKAELEERRRENNKPKLTESELQQKKQTERMLKNQEIVNENSDVLLSGPKKGNLISAIRGEDKLLEDMKYLYGFAIDMLIIMENDQHVNIKDYQYGKDARIWNAYFETIYDKKSKTEMLLNKYNVSSVDELLNLYEKIRNQYYKKFSKLSNEKKSKYNASKFAAYDIRSSLVTNGGAILQSLQNENLNFPPSKEKLIQMINSRIMNGRGYKFASPEDTEQVVTGRANSYEEYQKTKNYYKNLTKNMTVEETVNLYKRVNHDIQDSFKYSDINVNGYYAVMQRLFCELIFEKKGMKYSDGKQHSEVMLKIAKEYLEEDLKYSTSGYNNLSEEEKQKRQTTIEKEYIKYRANLTAKGEKKHLSFREFAEQKYSLDNVVEPSNIETMIENEIKGRNK